MECSTHTVQQLFERDVRYAVPLYQRPYVWDEDKQWAPLWDDISTLLEHQDTSDPAPIWSHFLGAVVLEQEPTAPGRIPRYTVIDGQQRLTTLQILLAAAAATLDSHGAKDDAGLLRDLTVNDPRKTKGTEKLKVWPTNANRSAFIAVLNPDGVPAGHIDDPENLIDEAFDYFKKKIKEYLVESLDEKESITDPLLASNHKESEAAPGTDIIIRAVRLRITLCELLKVVSITLDADDNAQVIFETLNARGTPLLALDLVKNAVFHRAERQGKDTDDLYTEVWRPQLDDAYWRRERRQGRLNRPIAELFLMHWLTMKLGQLIPATELFAKFRQGIMSDGVDAEALVSELCADAAVMRSFDSPEPGSPEASFFARMSALDAGTFTPIILLLFRSSEITQVRRLRALKILESWLARRALMRLTSKNYNRIVPRILSRMKSDLEHADDALLQSLSGTEGEISRWPHDEEFIQYLRTRDIYGNVSQPRIVMALSAVEASLYSGKTDIPQVAHGLSIEHILPQSWHKNWPLIGIDEADILAATARRQQEINRLGNLTVVTQPLNASLSNAGWPDKRKAFNAESKLLLNSRLTEHGCWDEQSIDERGSWLAEQLAWIWPGPEAGNWQSL
jgi:hypothetical protein